VRFPSFDNTQLKAAQQYIIQSEIIQAIGRARAMRYKDVEVLLFSKFPILEANEVYYRGSNLLDITKAA
jgi:hypothetical protein